MNELSKKLDRLIEQTTLTVTQRQKDQLLAYVALLNKWNKAYNLTSVRDPNDMVVKHIMDSIIVSPYLSGDKFIDVGTGPGLPGIPLAIMNPEKSFVLLDSLGKRIRFIKQVIHELNITNVTAIQCRVEDFQPNDKFDAVLSRAFASMADMVNWCHHLVDCEGVFLALKGIYSENEADELPEWCKIRDINVLNVPELEGKRHLITLIKEEIK